MKANLFIKGDHRFVEWKDALNDRSVLGIGRRVKTSLKAMNNQFFVTFQRIRTDYETAQP